MLGRTVVGVVAGGLFALLLFLLGGVEGGWPMAVAALVFGAIVAATSSWRSFLGVRKAPPAKGRKR